MSYVVDMGKCYKLFTSIVDEVGVDPNDLVKVRSLNEYHFLMAKKIKEKFNIDAILTQHDKNVTWDYLIFENENEYLLALLRFQ